MINCLNSLLIEDIKFYMYMIKFNYDIVIYTKLNIKNEIMKIVKTKPKIISLFTGCGGLDLGFHQAGYQTVWANDINSDACKTFERNFDSYINCGDIEKIDPYKDKSIPDCDLMLGGFPCQDFSMIWKRPGLDGERGNLYKSFLRFVDAKKPKAFVAENVRGLLTANNGMAIQQIISDFEKIAPGYVVKAKLYKFAEYGVPQFRERVLIVGIRVDTNFNFIHPPVTYGPAGTKPFVTAQEALKGVDKIKFNNEHINISSKTIAMLKRIPEGGNFSDIPKDDPLYVKGMISHVYRRLKLDEPSKTIIAAGGGGTWGYHFPEPRALTNRERARLQSFPDDFIFDGSVAEVRRQIGNAVSPKGVLDLAVTLKSLFSGNYKKNSLKDYNEHLKTLPFLKRLQQFENESIGL